MKEKAVLLGSDRSLVGVVTSPDTPDRDAPAILLLNAGIVHRVGPVRLHVKLARALAQKGHYVVRFDGSSIGDSPPASGTMSHEQRFVQEAIEVMNDLEYEHRVKSFVLMGVCSGAVTSFKAATQDSRIVAAVLMNPQGFDAGSAWNAHVKSRKWMREYLRKLFSLKSWGRALSGKSRYGRFLGLLLFRMKSRIKSDEKVTSVADNLANEAATLVNRGVRLFFVMTTDDESNDYINLIMGASSGSLRRNPLVSEHTISGSDHTFTCLRHQEELIQNISDWLEIVRCEDPRAPRAGVPSAAEGARP